MNATSFPRVLLVEDDPFVTLAFTQGFGRVLGLNVVAYAGTTADARRLAEERKPELALVDLNLHGVYAYDGITLLRAFPWKPKVLVTTMMEERDCVHRAFGAGAHGYLLKDAPIEEWSHAIEAIMAGERYLSPRIEYLVERGSAIESDKELAALTPRERQVHDRLQAGQTNKEIAFDLGISVETVREHRQNIYRKLGIASLGELVRRRPNS